MTALIRAVYEQGYLRLLDEVNLVEGQPVNIIIKEDDELAIMKTLLGDAVQWADPDSNPDPEIEEQAEEIFNSLRGIAPLSDLIIEERGEL